MSISAVRSIGRRVGVAEKRHTGGPLEGIEGVVLLQMGFSLIKMLHLVLATLISKVSCVCSLKMIDL